jgi:predicted RNA-binding protein with PUA-like domain
MPKLFLAKTDPETYSIKDLARDQITNWDGVHSNPALLVIRSWEIGDLVLVYHSQGQAKIMGLMEIIGSPVKDENDPRPSWYAKVKFLQEFTEENQVSLKEIKESGLFNDWLLVRQGRLSTMACPDNFTYWFQKRINQKLL